MKTNSLPGLLLAVVGFVGCAGPPMSGPASSALLDKTSSLSPRPVFLPTGVAIKNSLVEQIKKSTTFIAIGTMAFTSPEVADALIAQKEAHPELAITILVAGRSAHTASSKITVLQENGVIVHVVKGANLYHEKWVIADGTYVLVMSANISQRGLQHNYEVGVVFDDAVMFAKLLAHAEQIIAGWTPEDPFKNLPTSRVPQRVFAPISPAS